MMLVVIFDVELGQSIFFLPEEDPNYSMFIDCGNTKGLEPVDLIISRLTKNESSDIPILGNLTITNYDQDHFSGLPYLRTKVKIWTTSLNNNINVDDIKNVKLELTEPIKEIIELKEKYITSAEDYNPPYSKKIFSLSKEDFPDNTWDTNKLSQLVFITYKNSTICIPGDLPNCSWDLLLKKNEVIEYLRKTNIFLASHHGREDGYNACVFSYCEPEVIILSDKSIIHGTQENMTTKYATHVVGEGIQLGNDPINLRKILTTRNDGNILIGIGDNGIRAYSN